VTTVAVPCPRCGREYDVTLFVLFGGALLLALASVEQAAPAAALRGVTAALGAGLLWGTMYIPCRKAHLTGMNPLSFLAFFTLGELATMAGLAGAELGGPAAVSQTLAYFGLLVRPCSGEKLP